MENIKKIGNWWTEFRSIPYPKGYGGYEVDGIDLSSLETFTAGCISSFLAHQGKLDNWRTSVLGLCYRDLSVVNRKIEGSALDFFMRLEILARSVLEAVRDATKDLYA